jgi:adenylate cyclase
VNVAARLQDLSKRLGCRAVISEEVCKLAGLPADALTRTDVEIRGHERPMSVRTLDDPTVLAGLIDARSAVVE